jgi:hypothetical protein
VATSPEVVRAQLAVVTAAASQEVTSAVAGVTVERQVDAALAAVELIVPAYYDAAGTLAVAWYDEIRDESSPTVAYTPNIIGDPATDWIEREVEKYRRSLEVDIEAEVAAMLDEITRLAEKEAARGFRDSITGNTRMDEDAIGWSRVARPGACKLCVMLADKGAVYSEDTAIFAAHTDCHCAARPEFRNGEHGPEASVEQYLASTKRRTPAQRKVLRKYLNENYPESRG